MSVGISVRLDDPTYCVCAPIDYVLLGVPNMPESVISECSDGIIGDGALPACLPMNDYTWYTTR